MACTAARPAACDGRLVLPPRYAQHHGQRCARGAAATEPAGAARRSDRAHVHEPAGSVCFFVKRPKWAKSSPPTSATAWCNTSWQATRQIRETIFTDDACARRQRKGDPRLLDGLPPHETLFRAPPGKGLPIGNLNSQIFANVYLNALDKFVKHALKCRWYLRHCDDCVPLAASREQLLDWRERIRGFLAQHPLLEMNDARERRRPVADGVDFRGDIVRPFHLLVRRPVVGHLREKLHRAERAPVQERDGTTTWRFDRAALDALQATLASYLGHFRLRRPDRPPAAQCCWWRRRGRWGRASSSGRRCCAALRGRRREPSGCSRSDTGSSSARPEEPPRLAKNQSAPGRRICRGQESTPRLWSASHRGVLLIRLGAQHCRSGFAGWRFARHRARCDVAGGARGGQPSPLVPFLPRRGTHCASSREVRCGWGSTRGPAEPPRSFPSPQGYSLRVIARGAMWLGEHEGASRAPSFLSFPAGVLIARHRAMSTPCPDASGSDRPAGRSRAAWRAAS